MNQKPKPDREKGSSFFSYGRGKDGHYRFDPDLLPANFRLIGRGEIGGKARGLLFVIDRMRQGVRLTGFPQLIRFPDSTVLTTEIFDDFMRENRLERAVVAGCESAISLEELEERIVAAPFPKKWEEELAEFLKVESRPLVVRSSSVMEDNPDYSFAGIYLTDFLSNRGGFDQRLEELKRAIKRVYASTFAQNARAYRKRHGLDWHNEKMAILIQNMIGQPYPHDLFYPLIGGVAFSRNYYPWTARLKPEDGIVRLVVGTGTRAVGREYARVFSPAIPGLRPEGNDVKSIIRYSQETVDALDLKRGRLVQRRLNELDNPLLFKVCSIITQDGTIREPLSVTRNLAANERFLATFSRLIEGDSIIPFTPLIRQLLIDLEGLIGSPVDIEFAVDFPETGTPLFYLLQTRPLGNRPEHRRIRVPHVAPERVVLSAYHVLGNGRIEGIRHLVIVEPASYRLEEAYAIARTIGRINQRLVEADEPYILIGPGRWGSTNPGLGVPVKYGEISGAAVIVEMSTASFAPELSYGTHFYADMVASGILYLPLNEGEGDYLNRRLLAEQEIAYKDRYITHYTVPSGLNVYVNGETRHGLIALRRRVGERNVIRTGRRDKGGNPRPDAA